jgi:hypothetical protein
VELGLDRDWRREVGGIGREKDVFRSIILIFSDVGLISKIANCAE